MSELGDSVWKHGAFVGIIAFHLPMDEGAPGTQPCFPEATRTNDAEWVVDRLQPVVGCQSDVPPASSLET